MNVSPVSQGYSCKNNCSSFGANVSVSTKEMRNFMEYLKKNQVSEQGWYNSKKDLDLINKIFDAFEKHPSKEVITPDVAYIPETLFDARGTVASSRITLIDTEPARSDSIAPIKNIFRRILDPENKRSFNKLVGKEHSSVYDSWWKENISPIWEDINKNFREKTFFNGNFDKKFNSKFNRIN